MKNKDLLETKENIQNEIKEAIESGDTKKQAEAMSKLMEYTAQEAANDVKRAYREQENDDAIMTARGVKLLTSEEKKYFSELGDAIKDNKGSLETVTVAMPITTIDRIFEDLENEHPLLKYIDFQNVTGMIEIIIRTGDISAAWWGPLTDEIKKELDNGFEKKPTNIYKLSALLPIAKSLIDLGPAWLESFIRKTIVESLNIGMEDGMVVGDGKDKPIGMNRDLNGAVVNGVYPEKETVKIKDFTPETMANIIEPLTNNGKRAVQQVLLLVNPSDYILKIFPSTTKATALGTYVNNVFPFPTEVVQTTALKKGKAILGLDQKYFMGLGSERKIERSGHYKFAEDEEVFVGKLYGNGFPKDNASFIYLDISEMNVLGTNTDSENDNKEEGNEQEPQV